MTITLKVKYYDFQIVTRSVTVEEPVEEASEIMKHARSLLDKTAIQLAKKLGCWESRLQILQTIIIRTGSGYSCLCRFEPITFILTHENSSKSQVLFEKDGYHYLYCFMLSQN